MEHPLYIIADGNWVVPESKKDSQQTSSQCGPRQEVVIQVLVLERDMSRYSIGLHPPVHAPPTQATQPGVWMGFTISVKLV